jgi:hypothetical protein
MSRRISRPANHSASPLAKGERTEVRGSKLRMADKRKPSP